MSQLLFQPCERMSGRRLLVAFASMVALVFAFASFSTAAKADDSLSVSLDGGQLSVLPGLLDPVDLSGSMDAPVTIAAELDNAGDFTSQPEDFVFPTITIPLDDPTAASIIGDTIWGDMTPTGPFSGNFDAATGGFVTSIPLNLGLTFSGTLSEENPDGMGPFTCLLPMNLDLNTTDTLVIPQAEGPALEFPSAPFAPPVPRDGAAYGHWDEVLFTDVVDGPGTPPEAEGAFCQQLLGLLPMLIPDWPPEVQGIDGSMVLSGTATLASEEASDDVLVLTEGVGTFGSAVDVAANAPEGVAASFGGELAVGDVSVPAADAGLPTFEGEFGSISFEANGSYMAGTRTANGKLTVQGPVRVGLTLATDDGELNCHATTRLQLRTDQRALYDGARFSGGIYGAGALAARWDSIPNVRGDAGCAAAAADLSGPGGMQLSR